MDALLHNNDPVRYFVNHNSSLDLHVRVKIHVYIHMLGACHYVCPPQVNIDLVLLSICSYWENQFFDCLFRYLFLLRMSCQARSKGKVK